MGNLLRKGCDKKIGSVRCRRNLERERYMDIGFPSDLNPVAWTRLAEACFPLQSERNKGNSIFNM